LGPFQNLADAVHDGEPGFTFRALQVPVYSCRVQIAQGSSRNQSLIVRRGLSLLGPYASSA